MRVALLEIVLLRPPIADSILVECVITNGLTGQPFLAHIRQLDTDIPIGVNDTVFINHDRAVAERSTESPNRDIPTLRCFDLPTVQLKPPLIALLASMQMPVLRIGAGIDPGNQVNGVVHLDQQSGAVHTDTQQVLPVLIGRT